MLGAIAAAFGFAWLIFIMGGFVVLGVMILAGYDFKGVDLALFSPGSKVSAIHAPRAASAGAIVIDNTSQFRMDPDVPLVVPEVNPEAVAGYKRRGIIASDYCRSPSYVLDEHEQKQIEKFMSEFAEWLK